MLADVLRGISIRNRLIVLIGICIVLMLAGGVVGISRLHLLAQNGVNIKQSADKLVENVRENFKKTKLISDLQAEIAAFMRMPEKRNIQNVDRLLEKMERSIGTTNLDILGELRKQIKYLSVRQESLKANMTGIEKAYEAIQNRIGSLNTICHNDACKSAISVSIQAFRKITPLLNRAMNTTSSFQNISEAQQSITAIVEKTADRLEKLAQGLSVPEKKVVLATQGVFYDLDDALSSAVTICAKVFETQKAIEKILARIKSVFLSTPNSVSAEKTAQLAEKGMALAQKTTYMMWAGIICGITVLFFIATLFVNSIIHPLSEFKQLIGKMSSGDLTGRLVIMGQDELSQIGQAFNNFVDQFGQIVSRASDTGISLDEKSGELETLSRQIVNEAHRAKQAGNDALGGIENLLQFMQETKDQMGSLLEATNEITSNTMTTASLADGLGNHMEDSFSVISELESYANQVGEVTNVIRSITEQTTLLALNATIEAARAGEAGKGFAVVANEVKQLANQTQEATKKIAPLIENMQLNVSRAVESISNSKRVSNNIREAINTVVATAEDQATTFQEIDHQIQIGVKRTNDVKNKVVLLNQEAEQNLVESNELEQISSEISNHAFRLKEVISGLRC